MRISLVVIALSTFFVACNGGKKEDLKTDVQTVAPENSYNNSTLTDTGKTVVTSPQQVVKEEKPATKPAAQTNTKAPTTKPATTQTQAPVYQDNAPVTNTGSTQGTGVATTPASTGTETSTAPTSTEVKDKKGMSNAGKGAIIGGVAGAIGGAIISKKKGTGAVIGGVLGAAGGAIIGKKKDKKAAQDTAQ